MAEKLRVPLADVTRRYPDRLFALSVVADRDLVARYEASGLTVFEDPSRAVTAIAAMGRFGAAFAKTAPIAPRHGGDIVLPSSTPNEVDAKRLLASAGIACVPERLCATPDAAVQAAGAIGYPVVLKIVSPDILHKTEIGGVLLGIADDSAVRRGYATLVDRTREKAPAARIDGVLVARQLSGGVECILGIKHDPVFGPIAVFGLGGVFVEVLHDVVLRRCPFGEDVARDMILSIRSAPLLLGARGRPPVDVAALATMMSRLSMFAAAAGPRLVSIDLNPVFAMPEGQGAFAADAVIEIAG
jgi:hypothetical protein